MSDARQAIAVAKEAGAAEAAGRYLSEADTFLASAERSLNSRAYQKARRDAQQAKMKAMDALRASETRLDSN